jgi:Tol biopolymer transport system component
VTTAVVILALFLVLAHFQDGSRASGLPRLNGSSLPGNGLIAFDRDVPAKGRDVWVVAPDGTGLRRLTKGYDSRGPVWSPDGKKLAFTRQLPRYTGPYVINADGSGGKLVKVRPFGYGPSWSPDGTRLAFTKHVRAGKGTQTDIFVADLRRGGTRRLTTSPADDHDANWAPKGERIAFIRTREGPLGETRAIYAVDARGGRPEQLSSEFFYPGWRPSSATGVAWAPDGRALVFAVPTATRPGLYVVRRRLVTRLTRLENDQEPAWSPDGRTIAFVGLRPSRQPGLFVSLIDSDGSDRRILSRNDGYLPTWAPDGTQVAFVGSNPNGTLDVYVVDADGGGLRRLTNFENVKGLSWQPLPPR